MLVIRDPQMDALRAVQREQFYVRAESALRERHPERTAGMPRAELRALIATGSPRAAEYGLAGFDETVRFLGLCIELGPDFDDSRERPWAGYTLRLSGVPGRDKLDRIDARLKEESPCD